MLFLRYSSKSVLGEKKIHLVSIESGLVSSIMSSSGISVFWRNATSESRNFSLCIIVVVLPVPGPPSISTGTPSYK